MSLLTTRINKLRYRYYICDVFTEVRFGGNQLAVLPEAAGLSDRQMQQIAREFNFSETTFVFPAETGHTRKVRIFTPTTEVPFAGHPNVGTAFALAAAGEFGAIKTSLTVTFEEKAGLVPISIERREGNRLWCELSAPVRLFLGKTISAELLASAVSLAPEDVVTRTHFPQAASVGLPFLMAEVKDRAALARARTNVEKLAALVTEGMPADIHLYTHSADEFDIRARMFAPLDGVPEDPATGSANCALAGLLSHYNEAAEGIFHWRIAQGVEMGRPSILEARAEKRERIVTATWVGGGSVLVSEGVIEADPDLK
jgi:trans-2,3-dihydro-3-hydroxyanthranilate isomerase